VAEAIARFGEVLLRQAEKNNDTETLDQVLGILLEAGDLYEKARNKEGSAYIYRLRGEAFLASGKSALAQQAFEQALKFLEINDPGREMLLQKLALPPFSPPQTN
jgi:predicted negative regulator of RcsB-dependent stress response